MKDKQKFIESIKQTSVDEGLHFNQVLAIFAYERVIIRLAQSELLHESLIYKGGLVMRLVYNSSRFTKDLDASFTKISTEKLKFLVEGSLSEDLDDGFKFKSGRWSVINETNEYHGVRYSFEFSFLERTSQSLQIDFTHSELQTNFKLHPLENLKVSVKIYAKELIISEKLQTLVKRENLNTRAKDIYDINFLFESGFKPKELKDFIF